MLRAPSALPRFAALALCLPACGDSGRSDDSASGTGGTTLPNLTTITTAATSGDATGDGGSGSTSSAAGSTSGDSAGASTGGDSGPKFDLGVDTGGSTTGGVDTMCPCADKLDLIYVLSDDRELWTYDPLKNSFAMVGALGCPTADGTFSMGVGRDGFAWIQTTAPVDIFGTQYVGDLFRLDVNDPANCTDPGYTPGANDWMQFGMAFVSQSASDPCDNLYGQHWDGVAGSWGEGPGVGKLGVFDPVAMHMNTIGATDYNGAELTGTGDGRLYAFGGVPDAKLIQFDKTNAEVLETIPFNNFPLTEAFAFAFWGGDFYFFTLGDGVTSKVTKLDYDDSDGGGKALTVVNNSAPIRIVGAGVSTCAPVQPPG